MVAAADCGGYPRAGGDGLTEMEAAKKELVQYWLEKAAESFRVAKANFAMDSMAAAVNRLYYAAFYALSAVLAARGLKYGKHSAVQSALHRDFIKTGLISRDLGAVYDELVEARHEGDYTAFAAFEKEQVQTLTERTEIFLATIRVLALQSLQEEVGE